ncbi:hypothetical protein Tco_0500443 [Tanacetum coccineum]
MSLSESSLSLSHPPGFTPEGVVHHEKMGTANGEADNNEGKDNSVTFSARVMNTSQDIPEEMHSDSVGSKTVHNGGSVLGVMEDFIRIRSKHWTMLWMVVERFSYYQEVNRGDRLLSHGIVAACRISPVVEEDLFKGVWWEINMSRLKHGNDIILKIKSRLSKWKVKTLSIGGRLTLLKSVLGASPIYAMSIFTVPRGVLKALESIRCDLAQQFSSLCVGVELDPSDWNPFSGIYALFSYTDSLPSLMSRVGGHFLRSVVAYMED